MILRWNVGRALSSEDLMVLSLFESAAQRRKDDDDLKSMHKRYGAEIFDVLEARASDEELSDRDRKHWSRLLRKARLRFSE